MIVDLRDFDPSTPHDLCIVGSGPIGIALALAAAGRGMRVLLLESGKDQPSDFHLALNEAEIRFPDAHTPVRDANCRALGGTSLWWGGRCVPFDPIDFEKRPWIAQSGWPISYEEGAAYYPQAAKFFGVGAAAFSKQGPWENLDGLSFDSLERWAPDPNMARTHHDILAASQQIMIVLGATVTDLGFDADRRSVRKLIIRGEDHQLDLPVTRVVLACGGIQTPRLLLAVQQRQPDLFGGRDGPLGRFYMGHIFGKIADLVLDQPRRAAGLDFFLDGGVYARRRFMLPEAVQRAQQVMQISFAAGNARVSDPEHRNGALSLIWLVLASPLGKRMLPAALLQIYVGSGRRKYLAHIGNVVRTAIPTFISACRIYYERSIKRPSKPAVFLRSAGGRYTVHYHAEQSPDADNRLTSSANADALGMPRLDISFRFSEADAVRIVKAHHVLDEALRANGIGRLDFPSADDDSLTASVLQQARDGMHQIGGARMSDDESEGVVDRNCRVHGIDNLFLASTCVFPTSGQANPTFLGVALALRLADHLAHQDQPVGENALT